MQLKREWLIQFDKLTKEQAKKEIEKYVNWYNNERIQKKLGYLSPVQYRIKYLS
ncbi:MAG TPA: IS3 family transposase [Gallicola sp.]|nr:IS3 family transposase [Gallicola sp.]